jgi:hypothetical protein
VQRASCYHAYRIHGGNPWSIAGSKFSEAMGAIQQKLYENRKSVARFKRLRGQQVSSCPMCGSSVTGALDHFLPKEAFPEFSVMAANLVPACTSCNSSVKGRTYKGASPAEWLIHPYFDTLTTCRSPDRCLCVASLGFTSLSIPIHRSFRTSLMDSSAARCSAEHREGVLR